MAQPTGETWDFEWDASSGAVPSGMAYSGTPTFNSGIMTIAGSFSLDFDYAGDCIIEMELYESNSFNNNNPQICVLKAEQAGAKYVLDLVSNRHYLAYNIGSGNTATDIKSNEMHHYRIICNNGVFSLDVDRMQIASGGGASSQYNIMTGIWCTSDKVSSSTARIKSIKFRRLHMT